MSTVKFQATRLVGTGKRGILTPDENGYYTMPVGGLNTFNSAGKYYLLKGCEELFKSSSIFMRRVANGCVKGEVGHPKKTAGMSDDEYVNRILTIDEQNVCCHFKEIWLDENYGKNHPEFKNPDLVAVMAKVKPSGPKGDFLKKSFDNPDENVCFSIRSFTKDFYQRGTTYRVLDTIATFDYVNEGGIYNASKWSSPGLEHINPGLESLEEATVTQSQLRRFVGSHDLVGMEDSKGIAAELLRSIDIARANPPPGYAKW
jgi:hypothetical protein